jgi:hypothetical protein
MATCGGSQTGSCVAQRRVRSDCGARGRVTDFDKPPFLRAIVFNRGAVPDVQQFPFSLPIIQHLERIDLHPQVTFLVGENGSGKSTLLEQSPLLGASMQKVARAIKVSGADSTKRQ